MVECGGMGADKAWWRLPGKATDKASFPGWGKGVRAASQEIVVWTFPPSLLISGNHHGW